MLINWRTVNERFLRFVFNDFHSTYDELLDYINQPCLQDRRLHDMLTLICNSKLNKGFYFTLLYLNNPAGEFLF